MLYKGFGDVRSGSQVLVTAIGSSRSLVFANELKAAVRLFKLEPKVAYRGVLLTEEDFDPERWQFDGSKILAKVSELRAAWSYKRALAITRVAVFYRDLDFVFGLSDPSEGVALTSTARLLDPLQNTRLVERRVFKEAAHELGHLLGLAHCKNRKCIMSSTSLIRDIDLKEELCPSCKATISPDDKPK